jgi:hypothetical protein
LELGAGSGFKLVVLAELEITAFDLWKAVLTIAPGSRIITASE